MAHLRPTAVFLKIRDLLNTVACRLVNIYQPFEESSCLHLQAVQDVYLHCLTVEDKVSTFLRNVGNYLRFDTA